MVQCAALVETNHGIDNLIMNEYVCYGKGHTIHSSGQIQWFKNSVDDRSLQVGGQQRISTIDGYAMPLTCTGGLMYLSILGKPTDKDLERYPVVHLTGPHEWDPSVLDYTHPSGDGNRKCCMKNFKSSLFVALRILLQLTYCSIINVSIDYNWFDVSNLPRKKDILK